MHTQKSHRHWITFLALLSVTFLGLSCSKPESSPNTQDNSVVESSAIVETLEESKESEDATQALDLLDQVASTPEELKKKNENIEGKKKLLVRKGDYYSFKEDHKAALRAYEIAWKLSKKTDTSIAAKMANLYFERKMFANSVEFFELAEIQKLPTKDKILYVRALQYIQDPKLKDKLARLGLADYIHEYFLLSETCIHEPVRCEESIRSYGFTYEPGKTLQEALQTYENLGINDPIYKEALLLGAFYANEDYKAIAQIGDRILRSRPSYLPVLKLAGYAHYEMKNFDQALAHLEQYKVGESDDPQIDYIIGLIYFEKEDYVTSNLYLNNAVLGGFEPKDLAERKLAYNYYLLDLKKNMFQVLHHLLMDESAEETDFTNAIYLAIEENDLRKANMWAQRGMSLHPESPHIMALSGWILRLMGHLDKAKVVLGDVTKLDRKNALAYLQLGIIAFEEGDYKKAHTQFNRASILDPKGIFGSRVDEYLEIMVNREKELEQQTQDEKSE